MKQVQNLEIDCLLYYHHDIQQFKEAIDDSSEILSLSALWEPAPMDRWKHKLEQLTSFAKHKEKTVILIIDSWYQNHHQELLDCGVDEVIFLDFFLTLVYVRLIMRKESPVVQEWNPKNNRWLFLTGKANKPHRLGFVYHLYKEELLDQCDWSLYVTDLIYDECRQTYLKDLDDNEARSWLKKYSRNPDNIKLMTYDWGTHYSGIPYGNIYTQSLFQVVSETLWNTTGPWITEKVWIPMINRCPFIVLGFPGTTMELKKRGFYTFDEFLIDQDFDQPLSQEERFQSATRNIRHWLTELEKNAPLVQSQLDHNYQLLIDLACRNIQNLLDVCERHDLERDIFNLVPFVDHKWHAQWHNWYARIRDPLWPDCEREEDFHKLPDWIQKECIEVFGYKPWEKT